MGKKGTEVNHLDNIRAVLNRADSIDIREGAVSYLRYNLTLRRFAEYYGASFEGTVAAFCALSPNNDYMGNLRSLVTLLEGRRRGARVETLTVSTYNACRNRAWLFLNGTPFLEHTQGLKTRNFYMNILDPTDPIPVTVDGHMVSIWYGKRMRMVEAVRTNFKYEVVADGLREVASEAGLLANQLQATLWFTWKRLHNVVYSPQLNLLNDEDHWGLDIDPRYIRPFLPKKET